MERTSNHLPAGVTYVSDFDYDDRGPYLWLLPEGGTRRRRLYQDQTDGGWTVDSSDPATPAVEARLAAVPAPALTLPNPHDPNAFVEYRAEQCRKCDAMGPWVNWDDKMTDPNVVFSNSVTTVESTLIAIGAPLQPQETFAATICPSRFPRGER